MAQVGPLYQSPSWYTVNEVYSLSVDAFSANETFLGTEYIFDDIRYAVRTPGIFRGGLALVLAQTAVISVDYEYADPTNLSLSSRDGNNYQGAESDF
ncbi:MAG: hypothetical protein U5L96_10130 [Owenweeksia sp.]|nr:hypothetical protein [Owenweeksia sp.]